MSLLRLWDERGHMIANHSYTHREYSDPDFQKFSQDILRNEGLLKQLPHYRKYFRFPYLNEGNTVEQRGHTLRLHHNVLNGMFLGDVLQMFKGKGWKLISVEKAYTDLVFSAAPEIIPAGQSIIWALAKESGRFEKTLRYPGEDGEYEKDKMDALGL
jgi:peptidoglycan/xylan/chitin deacetylase (PgdA/CDA1 family)